MEAVAMNKVRVFLENKDVVLNCRKIEERIFCVSAPDKKYIVKFYKKLEHAIFESDVLKTLRGIEGVPCLYSSQLYGESYSILSYSEGKDLLQHSIDKQFREAEAKKIIRQVLQILEKIHERGIIHKDIKPENIIYDKKTEKVTLIDFEGRLTKCYVAPEKFDTGKMDVWSLGVTLYVMLTLYVPEKFSFVEVENGKISFENKGFSDDLVDFFNCVLETDHDLRYSVDACLEHEWLI
jgi:serine/threonine protein kinase